MAAVADNIRAAYALPPQSPEERLQRQIESEIWREEQRWRDEQQRLERERAQAEAAEWARRAAAIADQAAREKARRELREQNERMSRDREIANLHFQSAQHQAWQRNVETAARNAVLQQRRDALIADIEHGLTPLPPPPPEPAVVEIGLAEPAMQLREL